MRWILKLSLVGGVALFWAPEVAYSIPTEYLFEQKWSEDCATQNGVETSEYVVFSKTEQCDYFVDTFRVQSTCEPATFTALDANRVRMNTGEDGTYIIEFLWSSQISIMEVVSEKPFELKQVRVLGRADVRDDLMTNYLYCP